MNAIPDAGSIQGRHGLRRPSAHTPTARGRRAGRGGGSSERAVEPLGEHRTAPVPDRAVYEGEAEKAALAPEGDTAAEVEERGRTSPSVDEDLDRPSCRTTTPCRLSPGGPLTRTDCSNVPTLVSATESRPRRPGYPRSTRPARPHRLDLDHRSIERTRAPEASARAAQAGGTRVVVSRWKTTAGPGIVSPTGRLARWTKRVT
jgi:hypothetical protein